MIKMNSVNIKTKFFVQWNFCCIQFRLYAYINCLYENRKHIIEKSLLNMLYNNNMHQYHILYLITPLFPETGKA